MMYSDGSAFHNEELIMIRTRFITVLALALTPLALGEVPILKVTGGEVSGVIDDGVRAYKGIPFAAPPVGELRWRAPQV